MSASKLDLSMLEKVRARGGTFLYKDSVGNIYAKECRNCRQVKILDEFGNDKRGLGGKLARCLPCENARTRAYKVENPEKTKEQNRIYREENAKEIDERRRAKIIADPEGYRNYYQNYYAENKDNVLKHKRKWRMENSEYQRELVRDWERRNPNRVLLKGYKRRARKDALPDTFTLQQLENTLEFFDGGCALTGDVENLHWDHVIPIATGCGGTTEANMIPLRADLNQSKSATNLFEWFEREKDRLGLSIEKFNRLIEFLAEKNAMSVQDYRSFYYGQFQKKTGS